MLALLTAVPLILSAATKDAGYDLPAKFVANRVFVVPQTISGDTLELYTDSGGGIFLVSRAAERLKLKITTEPSDDPSQPPAQFATLPEFKKGFSIPFPPARKGKIPLLASEKAPKFDTYDGMLGEAWFNGHVMTWDYPNEKLRIEGSAWKADPASTRVALGLPTQNGERADNFARIGIRVDGKPIDMLFDTGASGELTPQALQAIHDDLPARRATSFIVDAIFRQWHNAHPDWRVIEHAENRTKASMIEVPDVELAGAHVGPVWFTWRPDKNFHEYMSGFMDKQVEGAIGGDAFRHFVITVDYPSGVAYFRCVQDCRKN